ncbi:MAG: hypothetical protein IJN86_00150 [Clostridia bacterium]|nr:hypothetical protein [Clostridia bacterium]
MKKIKDIALYSSLCFTLVMLLICVLYGSAESSLTNSDKGEVLSAASFADKAFLLFVYSVAVGFSFLLLDINAISKTARRVMHFILNYGLLLAFLIMFQKSNPEGNVTADTTMLIFAASFLFIAVYFAAMLIGKGINKFGALIDSRKK